MGKILRKMFNLTQVEPQEKKRKGRTTTGQKTHGWLSWSIIRDKINTTRKLRPAENPKNKFRR
jgi:hypothetical protein